MKPRHVKRLVVIPLLVGGLLAGMWMGSANAASDSGGTISESDCEVITNLQFESDAGSGYYGKTATAASKVFSDAADELEGRKLKSAMNKLAGVWAAAGRAKDVTAAAAVTVKAGKRYTKALTVYTNAHRDCFEQASASLDDEDDDSSSNGSSSTSTTEPDDTRSDDE